MSHVLEHHSYGKSLVRLTKVERRPDRHELRELSADIRLTGEFAETYIAGDNGRVVATDSLRNTVYAMAADGPLGTPESFALRLAGHFVDRYPQVTTAEVSLRETPFARLTVGDAPHPTAFRTDGAHVLTARATVARSSYGADSEALTAAVAAGVDNLFVVKTTDSAFRGFVRDEFTTLPEVDDRIFATLLSVEWGFRRPDIEGVDVTACRARATTALLETFAVHRSLSVQQTLYDMACAALEAVPELSFVELTAPNRHRIPFNLTPLGRENRNEVFVTTDEPHGLIHARVRRQS